MASRITDVQLGSLEAELRQIVRNLPRTAGAKAVRFFKEGFDRQGWVNDGKLDKWKDRSANAPRNKGRKILINTGRLRRSIRVLSTGPGYVEIGTDVPYAEAHNEGADKTVTATVKKHTRRSHQRKAHERDGKAIAAQTIKEHSVGGFTRKQRIKIPRRQFIGESPDVIKSVQREYFAQINAAIQRWSPNIKTIK